MRRLFIVALVSAIGMISFFIQPKSSNSIEGVDCSKAFCQEPRPFPFGKYYHIDSFKKRNDILMVAIRDSFDWFNKIPEGQREEYGFKSDTNHNQINFLYPIPNITGESTIEEMYSALEEPFSTWIVPITLDGRIVSVMSLIEENGNFRVYSFGSSTLASRLDSGWDFTGLPKELFKSNDFHAERWLNLRYVSFITPAVDVFMFPQESGKDPVTSEWILLYSDDGTAKRLNTQEIDELMNHVKNSRLQYSKRKQ